MVQDESLMARGSRRLGNAMNLTVHDTTYTITTEADLIRLLFALEVRDRLRGKAA